MLKDLNKLWSLLQKYLVLRLLLLINVYTKYKYLRYLGMLKPHYYNIRVFVRTSKTIWLVRRFYFRICKLFMIQRFKRFENGNNVIDIRKYR